MVRVVLLLSASIHAIGVVYTAALFHPALAARRLQAHRDAGWPALRRRLPLAAFNLVLLTTLGAGGVALAGGVFTTAFPTLPVLAAELAVMFLADEIYFYFFHRGLHAQGWLYRHIHRVHHRAYAPYPIDYICVHPAELVLGGGGMVLGLLCFVATRGQMSGWGFLGYLAWRSLRELDLHSGLPSPLLGRLRLLGTTEAHDHHHSRVTGNYAPNLKLLDRLFGTALPDRR